MEHARKMILVPAETIDRLHHQPSTAIGKSLEEWGKEGSRILNNPNLGNDEKVIRYLQAFFRTQRLYDQNRKPLTFTIDEQHLNREPDQNLNRDAEQNLNIEAVNDEVVQRQQDEIGEPPNIPTLRHHPPYEFIDRSVLQQRHHQLLDLPSTSSADDCNDFDEILQTVPKTFRDKGSILLKKLNKSGKVKWDESGRVQIENKIIPGSNIIDLINDALRNRKNTEPQGYAEFYSTLSKMSVPQELIGNPKRWNLICDFAAQRSSPDSPVFQSLWPRTPTRPIKGAKSTENFGLETTRRKLDWESFKL